eukprot:10391756-Heterocapsa_arctica.AAC.1
MSEGGCQAHLRSPGGQRAKMPTYGVLWAWQVPSPLPQAMLDRSAKPNACQSQTGQVRQGFPETHHHPPAAETLH